MKKVQCGMCLDWFFEHSIGFDGLCKACARQANEKEDEREELEQDLYNSFDIDDKSDTIPSELDKR